MDIQPIETGLRGAVEAAIRKQEGDNVSLNRWLYAASSSFGPTAIHRILSNRYGVWVSPKTVGKWISALPVSTAATE